MDEESLVYVEREQLRQLFIEKLTKAGLPRFMQIRQRFNGVCR